jgi:multicomponent Na+:H+ antiporter subunit E
MRSASLAAALLAFWLALSGHYTAWLIAMGVLSTLAITLAARRMGVDDSEGHPVELLVRAPIYWLWLAKEIALSALSVARTIMSPRLPISPSMTVVKASQRSAPAIATYANSITLTPGTITVGVRGNDLTVHALVRDGALDLESGRMDARVRWFEGGS